jgi:hypothetical protein
LLERYRGYLALERGLADATIVEYARVARLLRVERVSVLPCKLTVLV